MWLFLIASSPCSSTSRAADVVSALNARFRAGRPSDDPASAGVVVHAIDNRDNQLVKRFGPGAGLPVSASIGTLFGQMVSCSIMNAELPFFYSMRGQGGFVLSSAAVKRALLCSYPWDAWSDISVCPTDWRSSDTCVPGCPSEANQGLVPRVNRALAELECSKNPSKCKPAGGSSPRTTGRSIFGTGAFEVREITAGKELFAQRNSSSPSRVGPQVWPSLSLTQTMQLHKRHVASDTRARSELWRKKAGRRRPERSVWNQPPGQYNELILAADMVNSLLPSAIEAVYMRPCRADACRSKGQSSSRGAAAHAGAIAVHASLLRYLKRTAQELPLLELNMSNLVAPFRRAAA